MRPQTVYKFLAIQFVMFLVLAFALNQSDIYPFYSWNMFTDVRSQGELFRVQIDCLDSQCGLAQDFYSSRMQFQGNDSRQIFFTLRSFGYAYGNSSPGSLFTDYENRIVSLILKGRKSVEYTLREVKFDRIEYSLNHTSLSERNLVRRRCALGEEGIKCENL